MPTPTDLPIETLPIGCPYIYPIVSRTTAHYIDLADYHYPIAPVERYYPTPHATPCGQTLEPITDDPQTPIPPPGDIWPHCPLIVPPGPGDDSAGATGATGPCVNTQE